MNLKNYTSETPAATSLSKIEQFLVKAGASDISKKYENGSCISVTFRLKVKEIPVFFQLPAKVDACYKVLFSKIVKPAKAIAGKKSSEQVAREQAERTAWKIISDWVEMQYSMIQLEQAEAIEIFLPYVYDPETDQTFFEKIKAANYKGMKGLIGQGTNSEKLQ